MDKKKIKNIAIIVWSLSSGGAERAAGLLSKYLSEIYNVYLFLFTTENIVYEYGGEIVCISEDGLAEHLEYYLEQYKKRYEIDCAISFLDNANILNIKTKDHERVIVSERCLMSLVQDPFYQDIYQKKKLYKNADVIVSVAGGLRNDLVRFFDAPQEKIKTIYNFIQQRKIKSNADKDIVDSEVVEFLQDFTVFVNIGRLDEQKNQERLIKQFGLLYQERKDVRLLIIGSGSLKEKLINLINELNLNRAVKILPYCKNPFPYLKRAYAYVMTSHYEGLPNAILEAMCLEVPVVAVDCISGPRELLRGDSDYEEKIEMYQLCKRGILVTDDETEDDGRTHYFKDAMVYLLNHEDYMFKVREAERLYMEAYTNERILDQWISAIEGEQECSSNEEQKEKLDSSKRIVIYGAGKIGKKVLTQLKAQNIDIYSFAVTQKEGNPSKIQGIPVQNIEELIPYRKDIRVIMAIGDTMQQSLAVKRLTDMGFDDIYFMKLIPEMEFTKREERDRW